MFQKPRLSDGVLNRKHCSDKRFALVCAAGSGGFLVSGIQYG
jgi:hypothetical protein